MINKERSVSLAVAKTQGAKMCSKTVKPSLRGLFETIEYLSKEADMIRISRIDKT